MKVRIKLDREDDGRWIAEVRGLPGTSAGFLYGATRQEAVDHAKALAFESLAESLQSGRGAVRTNGVSFLIINPRRPWRAPRLRTGLEVLSP
jgi:predicted RNase H-like HicB family nuclease